MAVSLSGMTLYTNNDNEGSWAGTDGADTYNNAEQGTNSESWLVAKNSSETGTLTLTPGTAPSTTRGLFVFWMSSNLAPYYTDIRLDLQSSTNNFKQFICANSTNKAIGGQFIPSVVDYVNKGTATGTYAPASHTVTRIIVDNGSSGNIRSVINNWIDVMYFGPGHTISGTTTTDKLFAEAFAVDDLVANKYGILQNKSGVIFSQGDLDLAGTALVSDAETLVFVDTLNGYDIYNLDITGSVTLTNSNIYSSGTISYNLDASTATAFSMTGGTLGGYNSIVAAAGQTMSGIVFQEGGTGSFANTVSSSTFNTCGVNSFTGNGAFNTVRLDSCSPVTVTSMTGTGTTNQIQNCTFVSSGTGYAINLGTIDVSGGDVTLNWNAYASGYGTAQSTNAVVQVNVTGGGTNKLIISVGDGYDVPTVNNTGTGGAGDVSVIAGQITLTLTDLPNGTEVRFRQGTFTLQHTQNVTGNSVAYTYTGTPKVTISAGGIDNSGTAYDRRVLRDFILPSTSQSLPFDLTPSSGYI